MNSVQVFQIVLWLVLGWLIYMMTFRTKDWLELERSNRERNDRMMKGLGHAAKGGLWLAGRFLKK